MNNYKIYRKNNYIEVVNIATLETNCGHIKEVFVIKSNTRKATYKFLNIKDFSEKKVLPISQIFKEDGSGYSEEEFDTFYTENTGNFNGGGTAPTEVDTAFTEVAYSAVLSVPYNAQQPNFEVTLTGNLDLTITGTANGDLGLVNLYFTSTEVATLNGVTDLIITGAGEMIPVYFIHDGDGLKWYQDEVIDTSNFALREGTRLFHTTPTAYAATVTNVGVNCTTDFIDLSMVGFMIVKANGEKAIVDTITNITTYTTIEPFATDSTSAVTARARALWIKSDGSLVFYDKAGTVVISLNADLSINFGLYLTQQINGHMNMGDAYWKNGEILIDGQSNKIHVPQYAYYSSGNGTVVDTILRRDSAGIWKMTDGSDVLSFLKLKNVLPTLSTYANDAAADADATLPSNGFYKITGSRVVYQKP